MNMKVLEAAVRDNLGDITFKEAFDRTKRVLNISVTSYDKYEFSRILNYITAPNVVPVNSFTVFHMLIVAVDMECSVCLVCPALHVSTSGVDG